MKEMRFSSPVHLVSISASACRLPWTFTHTSLTVQAHTHANREPITFPALSIQALTQASTLAIRRQEQSNAELKKGGVAKVGGVGGREHTQTKERKPCRVMCKETAGVTGLPE